MAAVQHPLVPVEDAAVPVEGVEICNRVRSGIGERVDAALVGLVQIRIRAAGSIDRIVAVSAEDRVLPFASRYDVIS